MVNGEDEKIGKEEKVRKDGNTFNGSGATVAMVIAIAPLRRSSKGEETETANAPRNDSSVRSVWMLIH